MKLSAIMSETEFARLQELDAPMLGATPAAGATTLAPGQPAAADPQAQAKMQAQQALDRANQKKQIQDAISQKQKELQDLQKQLAQIR
jgi:phage-related minor tail protein